MHLPEFLLFASDATWTAIAAGALLLASLGAGLGERRRRRRSHIDAVGWMPWSTVSVLTFMTALVLLAMAGTAWLHR